MTTVMPPHMKWLTKSGETITLSTGEVIEVWNLKHEANDAVLSEWATHFRNHYCTDVDLPALIDGTGMSPKEYLMNVKFPDANAAPGPSIRAGDFAEILIADFAEFFLGYWCPRELRYDQKWSRNESTKGCDVVGFSFSQTEPGHPDDKLFVSEAKAKLTGAPSNRLQDAVNDSIKDHVREAYTLNALKQRFIERKDSLNAKKILRFQNIVDRPFKRINSAAAILDNAAFDSVLIGKTDITAHQNRSNLHLMIIRGLSLMSLVHALYERAANEA